MLFSRTRYTVLKNYDTLTATSRRANLQSLVHRLSPRNSLRYHPALLIGTVTVKMQSARGSSLTDRYSLTGFGKALEHARKECAS